jgi:hypothetical protein
MVGFRARGGVVYLHGVGGVRRDWARAMSGVLSDVDLQLQAPAYDDLLTTRGRIFAVPATAPDAAPASDADRERYLVRQRRMVDLIDEVAEHSPLSWPDALPHPSSAIDRLPLASVLRLPFFGLDQVGHYLDDAVRRTAVLHRVRAAVLAAPSPRIVIAHSLGSLVAWDLLADPRIRIDLLVTLGSPLASAAVRARRVGEAAPVGPARRVEFPYDRVGAWLNAVHPWDPVPAGRGLRSIYPAATDVFLPLAPSLTGNPVVRAVGAVASAATSHLDSTYLASRTLHAAVREAVRDAEPVRAAS